MSRSALDTASRRHLARRRVRRLRGRPGALGAARRRAAGPVLDLGCGTGRVALHLARRGHAVTGARPRAPRSSPSSTGAQPREELPAQAVIGDACELDLGRVFGLVLAPMQLLQLVGGDRERIACLAAIRRHLAPGGRGASRSRPARACRAGRGQPPLPDVREVDGWVYSSLPIEAASHRGGDRRPPPAPDRLARGRAERGAERGPPSSTSRPSGSRPRRAEAGLAVAGRASRSPPPTTTSAPPSSSWRHADGAARARPLSRSR